MRPEMRSVLFIALGALIGAAVPPRYFGLLILGGILVVVALLRPEGGGFGPQSNIQPSRGPRGPGKPPNQGGGGKREPRTLRLVYVREDEDDGPSAA